MEASKRLVPHQVNRNNELVTIGSIQQHIIDGNAYRVWDTSFNVAIDTSMNFAMVIPADCTPKVKFYVEADQSTNIRIIEDASWNHVIAGQKLTGMNFNRTSANTMCSSIYKAPSMDGKWASGTLISSKYSFAKSTTGGLGETIFGSGSDEYSMILAPSTLYVINIVNTGPATGNIAVTMRITELELGA